MSIMDKAWTIIYAMTDAEYKAWVSTGKFPTRLIPQRDKLRKENAAAAKRKKEVAA